MLEMLVERESHFQALIEDIRTSVCGKDPVPLILYGAGGGAKLACEILSKYGINISGLFVDDEYYIPNSHFEEFDIDTLDGIVKKFPKFNIMPAVYTISSKRLLSKISEFQSKINAGKIFTLDPVCDKLFSLDYDYIVENIEKFDETFYLLNDQISRESYISYLNTLITKDSKYLMKSISETQYFSDDLPFKLRHDEVFLDCGAFDGDTILDFCNATDRMYREIISLEPSPDNYLKLQNTVKKNEISNITLIPKGVWNKKETLFFEEAGEGSGVIENGRVSIEVDAIDNLVDEKEISYIKMDIRVELQALEGAQNCIIKNKPKLAIAVYHKIDDLITIPQYIKKILPEYKIYFRSHRHISYDHVIYAICD